MTIAPQRRKLSVGSLDLVVYIFFVLTAEALTVEETSLDLPKNPVKQPEFWDAGKAQFLRIFFCTDNAVTWKGIHVTYSVSSFLRDVFRSL